MLIWPFPFPFVAGLSKTNFGFHLNLFLEFVLLYKSDIVKSDNLYVTVLIKATTLGFQNIFFSTWGDDVLQAKALLVEHFYENLFISFVIFKTDPNIPFQFM